MSDRKDWGKTGGWLGRQISPSIFAESADDMLSSGQPPPPPPPPPPKDKKWLQAAKKTANTPLALKDDKKLPTISIQEKSGALLAVNKDNEIPVTTKNVHIAFVELQPSTIRRREEPENIVQPPVEEFDLIDLSDDSKSISTTRMIKEGKEDTAENEPLLEQSTLKFMMELDENKFLDFSKLPPVVEDLSQPCVPAKGGSQPYRSLSPSIYGKNPVPIFWPRVLVMMARDYRHKETWFDRKQLGELHVILCEPSSKYNNTSLSYEMRTKVRAGVSAVYFTNLINQFSMHKWRYNTSTEKRARTMFAAIGHDFVQYIQKMLFNLCIGEGTYISWHHTLLLPNARDFTRRSIFYKPKLVMGEGTIEDERGAYRGFSPHTSIMIQPIEGDCNRITAGEFLHLLCLAGDMYDDDLNTHAEHANFVMQSSYKVRLLVIHQLQARLLSAEIPLKFVEKSISNTRFPDWTPESQYAFKIRQSPYKSIYELKEHRGIIEMLLDTTETKRAVENELYPISYVPSPEEPQSPSEVAAAVAEAIAGAEAPIETYGFSLSDSDTSSESSSSSESSEDMDGSDQEYEDSDAEDEDLEDQEDYESDSPHPLAVYTPHALDVIEEDSEGEDQEAEEEYKSRYEEFFGASD